MSEEMESKKENLVENESDNEFYDAADAVELIEQKFNKFNVNETGLKSEEDEEVEEDFQSLPPNRNENLIEKLEEKVREMEREDIELEKEKNKVYYDQNEDSNEETEQERQERENFVPLHEKLNEELKKKREARNRAKGDQEMNEDEESDNDEKIDPHLIDEEKLKTEQENLTQEEKEERLKQAQEFKQTGNTLFKEEKFTEALEHYTNAIRTCPVDFQKERSVFYSNRSLCYFKLKGLEKCVSDCSKSIEFDPTFVKPLLRRAECHETLDKLDEAVNDYKRLMELDRSNYSYKHKCFELEEKIKERNEKLKTEMFGKLKDLGNMFLKPFGMSTENFQFVQDPNTGSYSVNFKK